MRSAQAERMNQRRRNVGAGRARPRVTAARGIVRDDVSWQARVGRPIPDPFSLRICEALTLPQAAFILADPELRAEAHRTHVNLEDIVTHWSCDVPERMRQCQAGLTSLDIYTLLREMNTRSIRYVLIGGLAGKIYCSSHATSDLDICHDRHPDNLNALAAMLRDIGAEYRRLPKYAPVAFEAGTLETETDFVFTTKLGNLDLIGEFTGVGNYEDAIEDAINVDVGGLRINVLAMPKLMLAKMSTGRPKDMLVYTELETVQKARAKLDLQH